MLIPSGYANYGTSPAQAKASHGIIHSPGPRERNEYAARVSGGLPPVANPAVCTRAPVYVLQYCETVASLMGSLTMLAPSFETNCPMT